jgi:hypothetical protein
MSVSAHDNGLAEVQQRVRDVRQTPRIEYAYYQQIAPVRNGKMPERSEFVRVACGDISQGGVSYVTPDEPDYESIVVALGPFNMTMFVVARVVSVKPIVAVNGQFFRVGCEFTERVHL